MKKYIPVQLLLLVILFTPISLSAQSSGLAGGIEGLHTVLDQLYAEMMPLCSSLTGVAGAIAGFAALWYIASRVWRHLANAEPIDFYPLFRPFVIGFAILIFPSVIGLINGVMQPTVAGTAAMVHNSDEAVATLLEQKQAAIQQTDAWQMYVGSTGSGDQDRWYKYTHPGGDPSDEGFIDGIGNDLKFAMAKASYNFRNSVKEWMSEVLQVLFAAASLCINTLRTFNLVILAILGPLVFGLSVFDGFQHTLKHWLARYINVFLWLPAANIFGAIIGKIQENMLRIDLAQIQSAGDTFFSSTDMGYLIFMIIGIVGYFTVPTVAGHIMYVGGVDSHSGKMTAIAGGAAGGAISGATSAAGSVGSSANKMLGSFNQSKNNQGQGSPSSNSSDRPNNYMREKLKGKS